MTAPRLWLKEGREESVRRQHPWIFSGGVARVEGAPPPGALVAVCNAAGEFLAWGHYSPRSQIRVRLCAWDEAADADGADFWRERMRRALALRATLRAGATQACRLIHAESDGIPGLIADLYGDTLVVQYLTAGADTRRELFADLLLELLKPRTIYERSDAEVREKEGLTPHEGTLRGAEPPEVIEVQENGLLFGVDVRQGHKTGFYLDQRDNRQKVREAVRDFVRGGKMPHLLNAFAYTGGFGVYGLSGGAAAVVNVDTSAEALALCRENLERNGFGRARVENLVGDAFAVLRQLRQEKRLFDIAILDPPKFAAAQKDVQRAARGYKDINMQALHLLRPGGLLFTFSCSGAISADLFQKIVFGAALDAGREVQIIGALMQGSDHPILLTFPEAAYLKGLICRVVQ